MKKRYGAEQIVAMPRQADVALGISPNPMEKRRATTGNAERQRGILLG
jgi:hypothetical protein